MSKHVQALFILAATGSLAEDYEGPNKKLRDFLASDLRKESAADTECGRDGCTTWSEPVKRDVAPSCFTIQQSEDLAIASFLDETPIVVRVTSVQVDPLNAVILDLPAGTESAYNSLIVTTCTGVDALSGDLVVWRQPGGEIAPGVIEATCGNPMPCTVGRVYTILPASDGESLWIDEGTQSVDVTELHDGRCSHDEVTNVR